MPRGKYVNHKGRTRHFTSPEEQQQESEEDSEQSTGSEDDEQSTGSEDDEQTGTAGAGASTSKQTGARKSARPAGAKSQKQQKRRSSDNDADTDEDSDDDTDEDSDLEARDMKKGVAALIEIKNPNRGTKKASQKLSQIKLDDLDESDSIKPELSRREREDIEKQKAMQRYKKLHAAGKTREAKADLARLALIRQQREEAAAKREAEKKSANDLSKKPMTK